MYSLNGVAWAFFIFTQSTTWTNIVRIFEMYNDIKRVLAEKGCIHEGYTEFSSATGSKPKW